MRYRWLIVFLFSMGYAQAQVPGFMGKRFSFFLEANPTPAAFVQNVNNEVAAFGEDARSATVNRFAFNFRPQVTAEYLVSRDISLGLSYSLIRMGTTRAYYDRMPDPDDIDYSTEPDYLIDSDVVRGQSLGFHIKLYQFDKSSSIAPIGFYHTFSGYLTQTNTYDDKKSSTKQFKNDFVYPVATYGFGRQSMIAKNLILKTGVEFGWAFVPFNFVKEDNTEWDVQEYSGYNVHQSLFGYYVFSINVALGYIPF